MNKTYSIVNTQILDMCKAFARNTAPSSFGHYSQKGQNNQAKIIDDIYGGKVGEVVAYSELLGKYGKISPPCFKLYTAKNKSWAPDLAIPSMGYEIAVKSRMANSPFPMSWIFETKDKGIFPCPNKGEKFVIFVDNDFNSHKSTIKAMVDVHWLHTNNLFSPTLKNFPGKRAVYYNQRHNYNHLSMFNSQLCQL